ncbi:uncharacterized protein LOC113563227 [Ooceraea biroi]|uniref:uncharacterized protein LOC113563227 n=1 Tax=Ooceraea biroi TaxID=2015173 RepID=UPI000F07C3A5|nr:uncharacterized protein LOC113563227 [Ooceraea biroi]
MDNNPSSAVAFDNLDPATCIGTCPAEDPKDVVLLPNDDCKKFCMCSNGIAWVQSCPEPLYFDTVEKICKQKRDAVCGIRIFSRRLFVTHNTLIANGDSKHLNTVDDDTEEMDNNPSSAVAFDNLDPATCIGTCPAEDPKDVVLLPNDDCKKFCMCSNGIAWVQSCPEPLYFDTVEKICKQKRDAVCGIRIFSRRLFVTHNTLIANGDSKHLNTVDDDTEEMDNNPSSTVAFDNLDPATCIGTCPAEDPKDVVLLPNDDCKKFCMCSNGIAWVQSCPEPLYFDTVEKICKQKRDAVCGVRIFSRRLFVTHNTLIANGDSKHLNTVDDDTEEMDNNPSSAVAFDNLDPATCIGTCPAEDPKDVVLLPNDDCKKFCMCSNGIAWVQSCPEPLYFDTVEKICKQKRDAVCGVRIFNRRLFVTHNTLIANSDSKHLNTVDDDTEEMDNNPSSAVAFDNLDPATCIGTCPAEDPKDVVLLPNDDCKKFCMCSNGIAWVQSCPEPLYFDTVEKICKQKRDAVCGIRIFSQRLFVTHNTLIANGDSKHLNTVDDDTEEMDNNPSSAVAFDNLDPATCIGTCPAEDPKDVVLLPNDDCKKFCMCSNGIAWVQSCPEPLYFDTVEKICKQKRDAVCGVRIFSRRLFVTHNTLIANGDSNHLNTVDDDTEEMDNNPSSAVAFDNLDPATCIGTCPAEDPKDVVLLPNDDCKKFCMCSNGIAWVQSCPEPLYFDTVEKICKQKRDAVCGVRIFSRRLFVTHNTLIANGDSKHLNTVDDDTEEMDNNPSSAVAFDNLDPATCIGTCPAEDPKDVVLLPNDDCKKFCMCSNGIAWVQSCPEPLYFDTVEKICKQKRDAVCGVRIFSRRLFVTHNTLIANGDSKHLNTVDDDTEEMDNNPSSAVAFDNLDPATCIGTCPAEDPKDVVLLPNDDCKKFCMCSNGIAWVQSCPEPLYFDTVEKICKQKRDAVCGIRIFSRRLFVTHNTLIANGDSKHLNTVDDDTEEMDNNPSSTVAFDNLDPATCIGTCPAEDPKDVVLLPNDDCKKFCMCSNGIAWVQSCPEPLYFDTVEKICKQKRDAVCGVRIFSRRLFVTHNTLIANGDSNHLNTVDDDTEEMDNNPSSAVAFDNLDPATCIGTCPAEDPKDVVLLPNDDCKKFCMCSNGIAWVQSCPEPLYFDTVEKICKQKRDAVCGIRIFSRRLFVTHNTLIANGDSKHLNTVDDDTEEMDNNPSSAVTFDNLDPATCIGTCPAEDPKDVVLLPNDDCKKFCMCSNGIAWVQSCPEPLYFDTVEKICKQKRDAEMDNNPSSAVAFDNLDPATCIGTCPAEDPKDVVLLPNDDCKKFSEERRCLWSTHISRRLFVTHNTLIANGDSNHLNTVDDDTEEMDNNPSSAVAFDNLDPATCIGTCPAEDPKDVVLLPNDDCKKFCMCSNGIAWIQSCPEPLYFDTVEKICKQKKDAVCGGRTVRRITENDGMEEMQSNPSSAVAFHNLDPSTCIGTCPAEDPKDVVLLPNDDCTKFCMCSNGVTWVQSCPKPLYFDSVEKVCKWKKDAVCAVRPFIQNVFIPDKPVPISIQ